MCSAAVWSVSVECNWSVSAEWSITSLSVRSITCDVSVECDWSVSGVECDCGL